MLVDMMLANLLIASILCSAVTGNPKESVAIILKKTPLPNSFGSFFQSILNHLLTNMTNPNHSFTKFIVQNMTINNNIISFIKW